MTDYAPPALMADTLNTEADRKIRVLLALADETETARLAGTDVRPAALKLARLAAEASRLRRTAEALVTGQLALATPEAETAESHGRFIPLDLADAAVALTKRADTRKRPASPPAANDLGSLPEDEPDDADLQEVADLLDKDSL